MSKIFSLNRLGGRVCLKTSFWVYRVAKIAGCVPFELVPDHKSEIRIRFCPGRWQKIKWYIANIVVQVSTIWLALTFLFHYISDGFTPDTPMHSMTLSANMISSIFHFTLFEDPETAMELVNQLSINRVRCDSKDSQGHPIRVWYTVPIAYLAIPYLGVVLIPLIPAAMATLDLLKPDFPYFGYYYLPEGWKNVGWRCFSSTVQFYSLLIGLAILEYFWIFWNESIFQTLIWLEEIRKGSMIYGDLGKWVNCYRRILVLSIIHNDFNGKYFTPLFYGIIVLLCTVYGYLALTIFGKVPIFIYIIYPMVSIFCCFLLTIFCGYHAKWSIKSASVLSELEKQAGQYMGLDKGDIRRQVKALKRIRNQVGSFGYTQEGTGQSLMFASGSRPDALYSLSLHNVYSAVLGREIQRMNGNLPHTTR